MNDRKQQAVMIFGCGYVGSALAQSLIAEGIHVGALTRNAEKAAQLREMGVAEVIVGQLASDDWHTALHSNYTQVVNCVSSAGGGLDGYRESYLKGQASILRWTKGRAIERYLYTSSTSVYPQDGGVWVDVSADTSGAPATGQILLQSEALLRDASHLAHWYVLRLAGVYGPDRHYLLDTLRKGATTIPGEGTYHLNLIHRDDIVSAIRRVLDLAPAAPSGIYNLADDQPSTKETLVGWLSEQMRVEAPQFDPDECSPRLRRRGGKMPNRRIKNKLFRTTFDWAPKYPGFREGYRDLLV